MKNMSHTNKKLIVESVIFDTTKVPHYERCAIIRAVVSAGHLPQIPKESDLYFTLTTTIGPYPDTRAKLEKIPGGYALGIFTSLKKRITFDDEGEYHSFNDLPAIKLFSPALQAYVKWYKHGKMHRLTGPALTRNNGDTEWYIDGKKYSEEDFKRERDRLLILHRKSDESGLDLTFETLCK